MTQIFGYAKINNLYNLKLYLTINTITCLIRKAHKKGATKIWEEYKLWEYE